MRARIRQLNNVAERGYKIARECGLFPADRVSASSLEDLQEVNMERCVR
jgi:hypothetical protein